MKKMIHSIIDFFPDKNQWFSFVDYFLSFKAITLLGFISGLFTLIIDNTDFLNRVSNLFRYLSEFKIEKISNKQPTTVSEFVGLWLIIFLTVIVIVQFFSFIKKWNEVKEKNKLLEELLQYSSRLTQNNTIHLTHTDKSFTQYEFSNYIICDILNIMKDLENSNISENSLYISDIKFLSGLLSTKMVRIFDKIYCKGLKNFLKNILKDNKFAMKKLLGGEVHIRLYFYSSDDGEFLYSSFVDDELFFSDSSLNHKICYSKDDERFQETQNPKTNKKLNIDKHKNIIFPIGSDNITNSKTEFYGFMEYDFGNISISEEEFLNNEFMQKTIKSLGIVIIEQLSYNMRVVRDNMNRVREQAPIEDGQHSEKFDFLKTIFYNF